MRFKLAGILAMAAFGISGCMENTTDAERGVIGAAAGATAAKVTGNDPMIGAAAGGAAGVFCDNVGVCR